MKLRSTAALFGAVVMAATVMTSTASATETTTTAACELGAGSVTAAGDHSSVGVTAGNPPTMSKPYVEPGIFPAGAVRLSTTFNNVPSVAGADRYGYVVEGDGLFWRSYNHNLGIDTNEKIGGGWSPFTALEVATLADIDPAAPQHTIAYALRNDGTLFRWTIGSNGWRSAGSYPGFASVKSMTLIAKKPTYDTFLMNTRGGALYTVRIPITSPLKPIVTPVRTATWQGFETLIATKCGNYGTLLLGIDKDSKSGYLYAVGHANGTATVINGLGKVNGTFPNAVNFRWAGAEWYDQLNGD